MDAKERAKDLKLVTIALAQAMLLEDKDAFYMVLEKVEMVDLPYLFESMTSLSVNLVRQLFPGHEAEVLGASSYFISQE